MWVCAGRSADLTDPGSFFVRELDGESVVVVRDRDSTLRAFLNICRHRGTRLCVADEGNFHGGIQCPYHAWTYDLTGKLLGAPHMDGTPGFEREDYSLYSVAVSTWDGHIFFNLDANARPLASQVDDLPGKFQSWRMGDLRRVARIGYDVRANWKLVIQNYSECLHCPLLHPALQGFSHYLSGRNDSPNPSYLGGCNELRDGVETLSIDGRRCGAVLEGLAPEDRSRVYYYAILPNFLLSLHPDYMMIHRLWPRGVDRTEIICEWHFHPVELARNDFDADRAVRFWDMTNRQDWEIIERVQLGMNSRAYTPGPYSNREDLLYGFDRIIAQDRPLRQATPPVE